MQTVRGVMIDAHVDFRNPMPKSIYGSNILQAIVAKSQLDVSQRLGSGPQHHPYRSNTIATKVLTERCSCVLFNCVPAQTELPLHINSHLRMWIICKHRGLEPSKLGLEPDQKSTTTLSTWTDTHGECFSCSW